VLYLVEVGQVGRIKIDKRYLTTYVVTKIGIFDELQVTDASIKQENSMITLITYLLTYLGINFPVTLCK
jgi:hypothetical protein